MNYTPEISVSQIDKFIGINILNKSLKKNDESLIIVIDNRTLYNEYSLICQNLPRLIEKKKDLINYLHIKIIYSYPKFGCININQDNIYYNISKLIKISTKNMGNDHFDDFFNYIMECLNHSKEVYKNIPVNCIIISNAYNNFIKENSIGKLRLINKETKLVYYDFNILNNIMMFDVDNLNYNNNLKNNDDANFINFIKNYLNNIQGENMILKLKNANFFGKDELPLEKTNNNFILIEKNNTGPIDILLEYDSNKIIVCNIENNLIECKNEVRYIENSLDFIKENNVHNAVDYINIYKIIIKRRYEQAQKEGNIEISRSLIWINKYLRELANTYLDNLIEINEDNNIVKLATKSENKIKLMKLKEKFRERMIKNKNMLNSSKHIYYIDENINKFIEEHENKITKSEFEKSCETFYSVISVSNWFDELKNGSSMGFMIKLSSDDISKLAIPGSRVKIEEITLTFLSIKDYIDSIIYHFDKNKNDYGNLNNKEIFKGNGLGCSNAVIPLYINNYHWQQAKKHMPYVFGIILAHNPLGYNENHLNFMFYLLADMTRRTFIENSSIMWLKLYFALLRTCSEIAFEKKYNKGIKSLINNYIEEPYKRLILRPFDNDVIIGQILCTGTKLESDKFNKFIEYIFEDCIRRKVSSLYNVNYIQYLITIKKEKKNELEEELNTLINYVDQNIKYITELLLSFTKMYKIIRELTSEIGGFIKFLNILEENYGSLPDVTCQNIFEKYIKVNKISDNISYKDLYKEINVQDEYMKSKILLCILQSIEYGKNKERKYAIDNNLLLKFDTNLTIDEILNIYEEKFENLQNIEFKK